MREGMWLYSHIPFALAADPLRSQATDGTPARMRRPLFGCPKG